MTKLTGAALDRAVANAMGLKSVNNCEQWGKEMIEEDDDIQDYKKPWVGLSEKDINELKYNLPDLYYWVDVVRATEKKLKEKNCG
jgi:hypothetical protein